MYFTFHRFFGVCHVQCGQDVFLEPLGLVVQLLLRPVAGGVVDFRIHQRLERSIVALPIPNFNFHHDTYRNREVDEVVVRAGEGGVHVPVLHPAGHPRRRQGRVDDGLTAMVKKGRSRTYIQD